MTEKAVRVWRVLHNMPVNVSIATIITANLVDCVTSDTEKKEYCSWRYVKCSGKVSALRTGNGTVPN